MVRHKHLFLHDLHGEGLAVIKGVTFTPREIDVISCLINGRSTKRISSLLSISSSTVLSHTNNIKLKIDCNSREAIIDFVEKSKVFPFIKKHYEYLVIYAAFKRCLKNIKEEIKEDNKKLKKQIKESQKIKTHLILCGESHVYKDLLHHHLHTHLKQVGIDVDVKNADKNTKMEELKNKPKVLILFLEKGGREKIPNGLCNFDTLDISEQGDYYFLVFDILKKFLQHLKLTKHTHDFREQYDGMEESAREFTPTHKNKMLKNNERGTLHTKMKFLKSTKRYFVFSIIFCIGLGYYTFHSFKDNKQILMAPHQEESKGDPLRSDLIRADLIRSDLPLPIPSVFLERPEEIAQINEKLQENHPKGEHPIQTIALVGPGGIGKTTLSRQYAQSQKEKIVWEINAQTHASLNSSFEDLATALAITEKDQKILIGFQDIKDARTREKKLIHFVKQHLRACPYWLLIYDNVGTFRDIQAFFPQDGGTWGQGKVILTTRNSNIQNNKYVKSFIQIKELNSLQKLTLFIKIATDGNLSLFTKTQKEEAQQFLANIPPFPLDVSMAAYYLKTTNISYELYLKSLKQNNADFTSMQENILNETGNYIKTRYGITTLSVKQLMNKHKDFKGLLLLISLLDSQAIPRSLLDEYQKDIHLVDALIFDLKKYSLITTHTPFSSSKASTFSIHRSTQEIILDYLIKELNLDKNHHLVQTIFKNLEKYIVNRIEKEDLVKLKLLVTHCERFLSHESLLTDHAKHSLMNDLAGVYLHLGNYLKAKQLLERNLSTTKQKISHSLNRARALAYLGNVYGDLGHYEKAKTALEQSVSIYQHDFPKHHAGLSKTLGYLGNVHRDLGDFEKAKTLLEQSHIIYQKHLPENSVGNAWISAYLGITYTILGEYDKARTHLEQSLLIYRKNPKNGMGVAWVLAHLGDVHAQLKNHEKAKDLFEQSVVLYKEHFPEGHIKLGWALATLGETYRALKEYNKAKEVLEQSLKIYKKHLVDNHVVIAGILVYLGAVHKDLGDLEKAKNFLDQSLIIYHKHFPKDHVEIAWALAHLGDIHRAMGQYTQAKALLEKSLSMYQRHFPPTHVEVVWAQECLTKVYQGLGEHGGAKKAKDLEAQNNENSE